MNGGGLFDMINATGGDGAGGGGHEVTRLPVTRVRANELLGGSEDKRTETFR